MTCSRRTRRRAGGLLGAALTAVAVLHLLWAAGMDNGLRSALGGTEPPGWIRPAAAAVGAVLALGCIALLQCAGLVRPLLPARWAERITWLLAVALLATAVINLFGRTTLERAVFAPLCLVLGSAALLIAREPRRMPATGAHAPNEGRMLRFERNRLSGS